MLDLVVEIIEIIKYMWLLLARTSSVDFVIRVTDVGMQTLPTQTMWFPNENITGNILWAVFQQVECYTPFFKTFLIRMWRLCNLGYLLITISGKAEWHKTERNTLGQCLYRKSCLITPWNQLNQLISTNNSRMYLCVFPLCVVNI